MLKKILLLALCVITDCICFFVVGKESFMWSVISQFLLFFAVLLVSKIKVLCLLICKHKRIYFLLAFMQILVPFINSLRATSLDEVVFMFIEFVNVICFFLFLYFISKEKELKE